MKKWIGLLLTFTLILSVTACGGAKQDNNEASSQEQEVGVATENKGDTLVVWTFTDELKGMIENHYLKDNPDLPYKVEVVVVPNDQYQNKLDPVLASGKSAPDVFALEAGYVKKYVDSPFTADLASIGFDRDNIDTLPYVLDVATDTNGVLKGSSWQATPGAFFYRRSLALEYLGTEEPEEVQALVSDFDKFYETAMTISEKSDGKVKMISSLGDLVQVFYAARQDGWVVENKLVVDPKITELMEMGRKLESNKLTNQSEQWTEQWFASISGNDVFGYFLPTWGLHYVLKTSAENADTGVSTSGDWGMIQGPSSYFWGGTWLAMREGSEMEAAAADLIEYLTLDEAFLKTWAEETGDVLSNEAVVNEIKDGFTEPFLKGQNHYAAFADMATKVDASILTGSDKDIQDLFTEQLTAYSKGEKERDAAMNDFISSVKNQFPSLEY